MKRRRNPSIVARRAYQGHAGVRGGHPPHVYCHDGQATLWQAAPIVQITVSWGGRTLPAMQNCACSTAPGPPPGPPPKPQPKLCSGHPRLCCGQAGAEAMGQASKLQVTRVGQTIEHCGSSRVTQHSGAQVKPQVTWRVGQANEQAIEQAT